HHDIDFRIPELPEKMAWEQLVDTASDSGFGADGRLFSADEVFPLKARSFALFINRAAERSAPNGMLRREAPPTGLPVELVSPPVPPERAGDEDETSP
ncbi:MAG TPA: hypothetical protein VE397_10805, partial [Stellaceae bacterium]|nr:hypothetical protein [Stellaceae bacterium]